MRSAPQFTPSVFGEGPTLTLHTVSIPILQPSNLKAFNLFQFSYLPPLCVSLPSFFARRPVFSTTSSLFFQNAGVGVPPQIPLLESTTYRLFFCAPSAKRLTVRPSPESFPRALGAVACPDRVGVANPVFVRPLFSQPYESLFPQLPCFHIHTKPRGVYPQTVGLRGNFRNYPLPTTHFNFRTTHYPLLTFRPRMIAYETR
jgi:hypothetical protein